ncbi:MAG TPA: CDGSH iron-sulfur domain-containing protein [Solirubrobacterales bacterium]|nr:CDGSH iron-sulfur domain-containing protein [Solirubrobacterales bacterium]
MSDPVDEPRIHVTEDGPYMLEGAAEVRDAKGETVSSNGKAFLCRCGRSSNKPFCDGTHNEVGFDGTETADHGPIAERRDSYAGDGVTIHDDRKVCAHAGVCTDTTPSVWKLKQEPWIDPTGAPAEEIKSTVQGCPSGALTYTEPGADGEPVEQAMSPGVKATVDGPYAVRGGIPVISAGGEPYEVRNRQTLCRCGGSSNKPFCDGTHWKGFKDPVEDDEG